MGGKSKIEWTEATWNPTTGCSKVSPGCAGCYAERLTAGILSHHPHYAGLTNAKGHFTGEVRCHEDSLDLPLHWRDPRTIFVNSMSDLFHKGVPFEFVHKVFSVAHLAPQHVYQILTKRPERAVEFEPWLRRGIRGLDGPTVFTPERIVPDDQLDDETFRRSRRGQYYPLPNVWLGASAENQETFDVRVPHLLRCPAAVRFLSLEPLLGPISLLRDFGPNVVGKTTIIHDRVNWVIVGGESGPGARPMNPDWVRSIRDQCGAAGVPFFFKQWGEWGPDYAFVRAVNVHPASGVVDNPNERMGPQGLAVAGCNSMFRVGKKAAGRRLDGRTWDEMPTGLSTENTESTEGRLKSASSVSSVE